MSQFPAAGVVIRPTYSVAAGVSCYPAEDVVPRRPLAGAGLVPRGGRQLRTNPPGPSAGPVRQLAEISYERWLWQDLDEVRYLADYGVIDDAEALAWSRLIRGRHEARVADLRAWLAATGCDMPLVVIWVGALTAVLVVAEIAVLPSAVSWTVRWRAGPFGRTAPVKPPMVSHCTRSRSWRAGSASGC